MYDLTLTPTFAKSECTSPVGLVSLCACILRPQLYTDVDRVQHLFICSYGPVLCLVFLVDIEHLYAIVAHG